MQDQLRRSSYFCEKQQTRRFTLVGCEKVPVSSCCTSMFSSPLRRHLLRPIVVPRQVSILSSRLSPSGVLPKRTLRLRNQSSRAQAPAAVAPAAAPPSRWHRIAQTIRYIRIPILVVSVYTLGYQQGVSTYYFQHFVIAFGNSPQCS